MKLYILVLLYLAVAASEAAQHAQHATPMELTDAVGDSDMAGLAHIMSAVSAASADEPPGHLLGTNCGRQAATAAVPARRLLQASRQQQQQQQQPVSTASKPHPVQATPRSTRPSPASNKVPARPAGTAAALKSVMAKSPVNSSPARPSSSSNPAAAKPLPPRPAKPAFATNHGPKGTVNNKKVNNNQNNMPLASAAGQKPLLATRGRAATPAKRDTTRPVASNLKMANRVGSSSSSSSGKHAPIRGIPAARAAVFAAPANAAAFTVSTKPAQQQQPAAAVKAATVSQKPAATAVPAISTAAPASATTAAAAAEPAAKPASNTTASHVANTTAAAAAPAKDSTTAAAKSAAAAAAADAAQSTAGAAAAAAGSAKEHGKKGKRYSSSRSSSGRSWSRSNRWDNWDNYSSWGSDVWAGTLPSYAAPYPRGYSRYGRRWGGYRPGSYSWGGYSSSHAGWPRYGGRSVCAFAGRARACSHTG